jgi:hypothetical protein
MLCKVHQTKMKLVSIEYTDDGIEVKIYKCEYGCEEYK